eukprot:tig00020614_g12176.t1
MEEAHDRASEVSGPVTEMMPEPGHEADQRETSALFRLEHASEGGGRLDAAWEAHEEEEGNQSGGDVAAWAERSVDLSEALTRTAKAAPAPSPPPAAAAPPEPPPEAPKRVPHKPPGGGAAPGAGEESPKRGRSRKPGKPSEHGKPRSKRPSADHSEDPKDGAGPSEAAGGAGPSGAGPAAGGPAEAGRGAGAESPERRRHRRKKSTGRTSRARSEREREAPDLGYLKNQRADERLRDWLEARKHLIANSQARQRQRVVKANIKINIFKLPTPPDGQAALLSPHHSMAEIAHPHLPPLATGLDGHGTRLPPIHGHPRPSPAPPPLPPAGPGRKRPPVPRAPAASTAALEAELQVLKYIKIREDEVEQCRRMARAVGELVRKGHEPARLKGQLAVLLDALRLHTVQCAEAVAAWRAASAKAPYPAALTPPEPGAPRPFFWNGSDYLSKVLVDLEFLDESPSMHEFLGFRVAGNPFLVPPLEAPSRSGDLEDPPSPAAARPPRGPAPRGSEPAQYRARLGPLSDLVRIRAAEAMLGTSAAPAAPTAAGRQILPPLGAHRGQQHHALAAKLPQPRRSLEELRAFAGADDEDEEEDPGAGRRGAGPARAPGRHPRPEPLPRESFGGDLASLSSPLSGRIRPRSRQHSPGRVSGGVVGPSAEQARRAAEPVAGSSRPGTPVPVDNKEEVVPDGEIAPLVDPDALPVIGEEGADGSRPRMARRSSSLVKKSGSFVRQRSFKGAGGAGARSSLESAVSTFAGEILADAQRDAGAGGPGDGVFSPPASRPGSATRPQAPADEAAGDLPAPGDADAEAAAVKIQAHYRGFKTRKEMTGGAEGGAAAEGEPDAPAEAAEAPPAEAAEAPPAEAPPAEAAPADAAAGDLPAPGDADAEAAAVKIQAHYRGFKTRKEMTGGAEGGAAADGEPDAPAEAAEAPPAEAAPADAAPADAAAGDLPAPGDADAEAAAVKIQAHYRGFKTRKEMTGGTEGGAAADGEPDAPAEAAEAPPAEAEPADAAAGDLPAPGDADAEAAAVKIQAHYRGFKTRKEMTGGTEGGAAADGEPDAPAEAAEAPPAEALPAEAAPADAAAGDQPAPGDADAEAAAVKIQAHYRGFKTRKEMTGGAEGGAAADGEPDAPAEAAEAAPADAAAGNLPAPGDAEAEAAAVKIQAHYRGFKTRKEMTGGAEGGAAADGEPDAPAEAAEAPPAEALPAEAAPADAVAGDLPAPGDADAEAAAVKIQAHYRGFKTRKEMTGGAEGGAAADGEPDAPAEAAEAPPAEAAPADAAAGDLPAPGDADAEAAAVKIQAHYRGFKTRKEMTGGAEGGAAADGEPEAPAEAAEAPPVEAAPADAAPADAAAGDQPAPGDADAEAAAVKIQAHYRGFKTRKEMMGGAEGGAAADGEPDAPAEAAEAPPAEAAPADAAAGDLPAPGDADAEAAAVKIQAHYRGFKTRKEMTGGAEGGAAADGEPDAPAEAAEAPPAEAAAVEAAPVDAAAGDLPAPGDADAEAAAVKIQAHYRGFKTRKEMTGGAEGGAAADGEPDAPAEAAEAPPAEAAAAEAAPAEATGPAKAAADEAEAAEASATAADREVVPEAAGAPEAEAPADPEGPPQGSSPGEAVADDTAPE